ncbi:DNA-binding transcriptional regulator, GntR family [Pseudomonas arsenicoxydans]|uniref:DNA-binding transcriptional regulator, GntR family n=1 Tax=Pseudomonas arsenicoxydans TaxID=702115 RepID=A0A1H0GAU1_9PSED|nr:GntR family transcriptional regulator [Pseudomonas arsenicoxydans]SDO03889.1 DNA-binding transcriptional regulator, GntR family [Pseudomonas arsenicoxydans]
MNSFASPQTLAALPFPSPADNLYSRVFDAILEQRIDATSRFTEESLAQMFGARRSDIRGVLTRLSHQHIIVLRTNHRPRIAALDHEQTRQMLHARRLTETTLVRLACQQSRPQDFKPLRALIECERDCTARGPAIRLSGEFHLRLAEMAGNAPLAHFLGSLVPLTSLAIAHFAAQARGYCVWQVHEALVDAVEKRDGQKAQTLLSQHLDHLEEMLLNTGLASSLNRVAG